CLLVVTSSLVFLLMSRPPPSTLFPYTTLFRSSCEVLIPGLSCAQAQWRVAASLLPSRAPPIMLWHSLNRVLDQLRPRRQGVVLRSEEHTSELQSRENLVCRLLLEKKNTRQLLR